MRNLEVVRYPMQVYSDSESDFDTDLDSSFHEDPENPEWYNNMDTTTTTTESDSEDDENADDEFEYEPEGSELNNECLGGYMEEDVDDTHPGYESPSPITSIYTTDSETSLQVYPLPVHPSPFLIDKIEDLLVMVIDNFNLETVKNQHLPLQFFISKCTPEIMGPLLCSDFLGTLWYSTWKLYVPELIYGYLHFSINSRTGASEFITKLRNFGKIVVLKKGEVTPVDISLLQTLLNTDCESVNVVSAEFGLLTHWVRFSINKSNGTSIRSSQVGTLIYQDVMLGGRYPTEPSEKGFPISAMNGLLKDGRKEAYRIFGKRLDKLRQLMAMNKRTHFEIQFNNTDKLVDLWYLKHLSDHCHTKIHVTSQFHQFVVKYLPEFADCFNSTNAYGGCRFHYDCTKINGLPDCLSATELNAFRLNSTTLKVSTIWVGRKALVPEDVSLFFIHAGDEGDEE